MTDPPRKRFQIHLSTAVVMMLVAGGLIWANVAPWKNQIYGYWIPDFTMMKSQPTIAGDVIAFSDWENEVRAGRGWGNGNVYLDTHYQYHRYGFPTAIAKQYYWTIVYVDKPPRLILVDVEFWSPAIFINLAVAVFNLFTIWFVCESLIRRTAEGSLTTPTPEPPPQKLFKIHIFTAVVMTIAAGGLVWANVMEERHPKHQEHSYFGWPETLFQRLTISTTEAVKEFYYQSAVINVVIAINFVWAVWFVCEWWIRRRAARKGT